LSYTVNYTHTMIIAITGNAGAGKDTAGDWLVYQYGFTRLCFADPLRVAGNALFALDPDIPPEWKDEPGPTGVSYRRGLQVLGTDIVREQFSALFPELKWDSTEHWIHLLKARIEKHPNKDIVITDLRFLNEAKAIHEWGGRILSIHRGPPSEDTHPSETGVKDILASIPDVYTLHNTGTIDELNCQVNKCISDII
jgi:hypothetical protein